MKKVIPLLMVITILGLPVGGLTNATMATPVDNLIVVLDDYDPAISDAVDTLREDLDQYKIVRYGSFEYMWTVGLKSIKNAILVGHGLKDTGVLVNGDIISWKAYASIANRINAQKLHFLNCGSENVYEFIENRGIGFTFPNSVDAKFGAFLISLSITKEISIASKAFDHIRELKNGIIDPLFLTWEGTSTKAQYFLDQDPNHDNNEITGNIAILLLNLFNLGGFKIAKSTMMSSEASTLMRLLAGIWFTGSITVMILSINQKFADLTGYSSPLAVPLSVAKDTITALGSTLLNLLFEVADFLYDRYSEFQNILIDLLGLSIVISILYFFGNFIVGAISSALYWIAKIIILYAGFFAWGWWAYKDWNDCDSKFSMTTGVGGSCSPSPPPPPPPDDPYQIY